MSRTLKLTAALLGSLMLFASARAGDLALQAKIDAPDAVSAGQLVRLEATLVRQREHFQDEINTAGEETIRFAWRLVTPPEGYDLAEWTFDEGRTVVFATAQPGTYQFVLAAAVTVSSDAEPTLLLAEHTLVVGGPQPNPKPPAPPAPPQPEPEPQPDLPEGEFGLARTVYDLALAAVPASERSLAANLAENYRAVAAQIVAGTLLAPEEILAATAEGNRTALKAKAEAWRPFFTALAERMKVLDSASRLATSEDYASAWTEIATGLDAVR